MKEKNCSECTKKNMCKAYEKITHAVGHMNGKMDSGEAAHYFDCQEYERIFYDKIEEKKAIEETVEELCNWVKNY